MQGMRFLLQPGPVHAERNGPCGRRHHPGQNAKQGGLAGPVDAGHGKALSAEQGKRKLPEKESPAEPAGNAAYVQNRQSIPGPRHVPWIIVAGIVYALRRVVQKLQTLETMGAVFIRGYSFF